MMAGAIPIRVTAADGLPAEIAALGTEAKPESAPAFPFRAVQDIVIIEQLVKDMSEGGIALVDDGRKFPCGRVVAHGPGRTYAFYMDANGNTQAGHTVPMQIKVGDWVVFGRYNSGGEPIQVGNKKYLMCREGDIGLVALSGEPEVKLCPSDPLPA